MRPARTGRWAAGVATACILSLCVAVPAGAEDLPPGFTDGLPVGEELGTPDQRVAVAAATTRYFGAEAYVAVRSAVAATTRTCTISDDSLTAMVLAPVFKESSAATTPDSAPSPMTLSRYDEWSGTFGEDTNANANYGLYAFRDPYTPYPRAFWHPGIGIWQYDSAGLGAPLTTIEAMDVGVVSGAAAALMAGKYCAAAGTELDKRYAAWADWGFPCTLCEGFYQEMIGTSPPFDNLEVVGGITPLGGVVERSCLLAGATETQPCWYVDPSVGVIQGATAWATLDPTGGSGPTVAPTPLSEPFYVVDRGTTEERHWLSVDSGYPISITAVRTIGKNARPRSSQAGSGLTWLATSGLCDVTTGRGTCVPVPPEGVSAASVSVSSANRPVALDADGDGVEDVLWYAPGAPADLLWMGGGAGAFSPAPAKILGTYDDVLAGDVDGDGDDDVVLYARASGAAYLLRSDGDATFTIVALSIGAGRWPFLLDANGDGDDELFWYGVNALPDAIWNWVGSGFVPSARTVPGDFTPHVGDFDGNGVDDIFWYAPGPTVDKLWLIGPTMGYSSLARPVSGTYQVSVGDWDGDLADDILWYAPGSSGDYVWFGGAGGVFTTTGTTINGTYTPVVASLDDTGRDSVILYGLGAAPDFWLRWSAGRALTSDPLILPGEHQALVGGFSAGGADGILWYRSGVTPDTVWYR